MKEGGLIARLLPGELGDRSRNVLYLVAGNTFRLLVGIGISAAILRALGPRDMGRLTLALSVVGLIFIIGEFGFRSAAVHHIAHSRKEDPERAAEVARTFLICRLFLSGVAAGVVLLTAGLIGTHLYPEADVVGIIRLAAITAVGAALLGYTMVVLEANKRFAALSIVGVLQGLLRAVLILALFLTASLNIITLIIVQAVVPVSIFVYSLFVMPKAYRSLKRPLLAHLGELVDFTKWLAVASFATMIFLRLDILFLSYFRSSSDVGAYAAATTLILQLHIVKSAILVTSFPEASVKQTRAELRQYVRHTWRLTGLTSLFFLPLFLLGPFLIVFLFGQAYQPGVAAFYPLLAAFLIELNTEPIQYPLYPLKQVRWIAFRDLILLLTTLVWCVVLIPPFGLLGAAWVVLVNRCLAGGINLLLVRHYLFSRSAEEE